MSENRAQLAYEKFAKSYRNAGGPIHHAPWEHLQPLDRSHWFAVVRTLEQALENTEIQRPTEQLIRLKFDVSDLDGLLDRCNHTGAVAEWGRRVDAQYKSILEAIMKTQADLDAGISTLTADDAAVLAAVATAGTATSSALTDLLAAIKANPTAPVSDFTDEVNALAQTHTDFQAAISSLQAVTDSAKSDDPGKAAAAATTLTLTASPTAPDATTSITLSGSVTGGATTPTGSVTITDPTGAVSASATLDSSGAFTTTVGPLAVGSYSLQASYGGDSANASSTGTLSVTVVAAAGGAGAGDGTVQTIPGGPVTGV